MLRQLSSSHDNGHSMVIYHLSIQMLRQLSSSLDNVQSIANHPYCTKHALSVAIVLEQRSEHSNVCLKYESCSVSCHRLMPTVRAWKCIPQVRNMLHQFSSSNDNKFLCGVCGTPFCT